MKTLTIKIKNVISNVTKSLITNYIKYCQKLDFKLSPNIPIKALMIKVKNNSISN
jgi:uncharacterized ubiquitin-like protein YukD